MRRDASEGKGSRGSREAEVSKGSNGSKESAVGSGAEGGGSSGERRRGPSLSNVAEAPYLGIALLVSWHYCLWFTPNAMGYAGLFSADVTYTWLVDLAASALFLFALPFALRGRRLGVHAWAAPVGALGTAASTLAVCFSALFVPASDYLIASSVLAIAGAFCAALQWIAWGERYVAERCTFAVGQLAPTIAFSLLVTMAASALLPTPAAAVFIAALPLVSWTLYRRGDFDAATVEPPTLLPKPSRIPMVKTAAVLCLVVFSLSLCSSFAGGIIPYELRGIGEGASLLPWSLAGGIVVVGALLAMCATRFGDASAYALIPILVVFGIVTLALIVKSGLVASMVAFAIAIGLGVVIEVLIVAFCGTLATKGYVSAAAAFGFSSGIVRASAFLGDGAAVALRYTGTANHELTMNICLVLICVLAALLIAATRQERAIVALTTAPLSVDAVAEVCGQAAKEFKLSPREEEILRLLARSNGVDAIAKKLVLSPFTVQTHVQHIYRKMQVHKRSELMDYINLRREEVDSQGGLR